MPIAIAPKDTALKIVKILADEKLKTHLNNLGILENGEITVVSKEAGSTIVLVKGVKLALDRNLSTKILVG